MVSEELNFWDWLGEVNQKLTFFRLKVSVDHKEPPEGDYELIRLLHRIFDRGEFPLYANKLDQTDETAVQQGLFSDGTEVESTEENQNLKDDELQ